MPQNGLVDQVVDDEEKNDVNDKDIGEINLDGEHHEDVDSSESHGDGEDGEERLVLRQAGTHHLMVDVVLVSIKEWPSLPQPHDHHPHHVEHGHDEHGDGEYESVFVVGHHIGVVHGKLDKKKS